MLLVTFTTNIVSSTYQHSQYSQAAEEEITEPIRRRGPCSLLTGPLWLRPQCEAHFKQGHHWRVHYSELTFINGWSLLQSQLLSVWDCRSLWTWQVWMQLATALCIYSLYILDWFGVMIIIVIKMERWCHCDAVWQWSFFLIIQIQSFQFHTSMTDDWTMTSEFYVFIPRHVSADTCDAVSSRVSGWYGWTLFVWVAYWQNCCLCW